MPKTRRLLSNFSKGELSPLLDGRPDLAAYFEGAKTLENWLLLRQGGVTRRPGTRFVVEVKDSSKATILLPFEASVTATYVIEAGHLYFRFYKNGQQIATGPELITNGTFDTGISGWTILTAPVTWHSPTQAMLVGGNIFVTSHVEQAIAIADVGSAHTLTFQVRGFESVTVRAGTTSGGQNILADSVRGTGSHTITVIPTGPTLYLGFRKQSSAALIDNVSVISTVGTPIEVVTPYTEGDLRLLHFTQSVDVLYLFHPSYQQRKLSRLSDTSWTLTPITYLPPPSFVADTDISGGTATLTPGATTGNSVIFTASSAVFLEADVGRQIIFGAARAAIVAFGASAGDTASPNDQVRADIIDAFPNTNPIPAGSWRLRLSPQTTLDPNRNGPVGAQATLVAGTPAFRAADVGKFLVIYGGIIKITAVDSATQVRGTVLSLLQVPS